MQKIIEEIRKAIERVDYGECIEIFDLGTLFEEYEIDNDNDYINLIHRDIPEAIRDILSKIGIENIEIYHLKDDVQAYEYIVTNGRLTFFIDIDKECCEENDETVICNIYIPKIRICKGIPSKILLVYYHSV